MSWRVVLNGQDSHSNERSSVCTTRCILGLDWVGKVNGQSWHRQIVSDDPETRIGSTVWMSRWSSIWRSTDLISLFSYVQLAIGQPYIRRPPDVRDVMSSVVKGILIRLLKSRSLFLSLRWCVGDFLQRDSWSFLLQYPD